MEKKLKNIKKILLSFLIITICLIISFSFNVFAYTDIGNGSDYYSSWRFDYHTRRWVVA